MHPGLYFAFYNGIQLNASDSTHKTKITSALHFRHIGGILFLIGVIA